MTVAKTRMLVVSPHADDEVIGCGGTIAGAASRGTEVTLIIMATGGIKHHHLRTAASTDERLAEISKACAILGIAHHRVLFPGDDMRLETKPMLELVTALDEVLAAATYDACYFPEPNHNLDHRLTHDAVMAALRPRGRTAIGFTAIYEGTTQNAYAPGWPGGHLYVDIAPTLQTKIAALEAYESQIRPFPHPASPEALRAVARARGLECGLDYAERFRILSMVRQ